MAARRALAKAAPKVVHFPTQAAFRGWLAAHHRDVPELWVGFYRKDSGREGLSYPQALDEALCFGWIDGLRRSCGTDSYTSRFTPRKARSTWSLVNVRHVERLMAAGRMCPSGIRAYEARDPERIGIYSFENRPERLPGPLERVFRANRRAWEHWNLQPQGYRKRATWWVTSAVRERTRIERLSRVVDASAGGERLHLLA
jgi:uncharacterized protein YdeI (YjbR/CyaY-like superfamily)